jgi:hypothetical protein
MENKPTNVEELFQKFKTYVDVRIDLFKLKSVNRLSGLMTNAITIIILSLLFCTVLLCLTIGFALWIGDSMGKARYGFFIVAGIYFIIGLLLYSLRKKVLKIPISNKLIKALFR